MITTNSLFAALGLSFTIFGLLGYTNRFQGAILIPDNIMKSKKNKSWFLGPGKLIETKKKKKMVHNYSDHRIRSGHLGNFNSGSH
jgi:hypothetical protein